MAKPIFVVSGLLFGDEGKGTIVDYLVRRFKLDKVIRFNGGPQAAHNVVLPNGLHHCFAQFGSGSLVPKVKTYLAAPTLVSPFNLLKEYEVLAAKGFDDALDRLYIDADCYLVTPIHALMNRIRETARGDKRHGSCGKGVGEAALDAETIPDITPRARDLTHNNQNELRDKLWQLLAIKIQEAKQLFNESDNKISISFWLEQLLSLNIDELVNDYRECAKLIKIIPHWKILEAISKGNAVFEGAQGMLIHKNWGFFPHITRSKTGFENALQLIYEADYPGQPVRLAVLRPYFTRHGHGPFVTENANLARYISPCHNTTNNTANAWQGDLRLGEFDVIAARYALNCLGGADGLVITNLDRFPFEILQNICIGYQVPNDLTQDQRRYFEFSKTSSNLALKLVSNNDKTDELAKILFRCQPQFRNIQPRQKLPYPSFSVQHLFQHWLKVPVVITSYSPTWEGKKCNL